MKRRIERDDLFKNSFSVLLFHLQIFELTHFWEACPTKSPPHPEPSNSPGVPVIVASAAGGFFALIWLIYAVRYCTKERNGNNDDGERQPILGNEIHNPIEGLDPANRSRPSPSGLSHAKADVNVIGSVHS